MSTSRTALVSCVTLLACTLALCGCKHAVENAPEPVVIVQAALPSRGTISEHILADATLAPLAQAAISPKITAPIHAYYVQRGSKVKAGQLLAVLESRDLAAQALDTKGQYTAAEASYDMETKAQVPEDYAKAQLDVENAKAQLQLAEAVATARKKLFEQGAIAGRDYDTARAAQVSAQAAYDTARSHLQALANVSRAASLKLAAGQLTSAQGRYNAAAAQVSYARISSPIAGVVTDRPLFAGETAVPGSPIVTVMDTSSLLAKVHLSQVVSQALAVGDSASVSIPGVTEPVKGTVTLISPALDPGSTTVEVWLRIANPLGTYKAGTPVRVSVAGRSVTNAITIPLEAVLTAEDGTRSVMVVGADGTAHKVAVVLGIEDGKNVQVLEGLNPRQSVITQGAYGLSEGTKVQVGKAGEDK